MDRDVDLNRGRRIRAQREKMGLSQSELAYLVHVSQGRISQIEKGAALPDSLLSALCSIFMVDESYILTGNADDNVVFLDSGDYYRKAVETQLREYRYKKVKSPVCGCLPPVDLPKDDPAFKVISRLLRSCDCTYSVTTREVRDRDGELLYPAITYTFALRCRYIIMGYVFEAFEIDRQYKDPMPELKDGRWGDSKRLYDRRPRRTMDDNVYFRPYRFEMFSERDGMSEYDNPDVNDDPYYLSPGEYTQYMIACDRARAEGTFPPSSPLETERIRSFCEDRYEFDERGLIDRVHEFERFKKLIDRGVNYKTLDSCNRRVVRGFYNPDEVVFSGREHSLESIGRVKICRNDNNGNVSFLVDDREITGGQFLYLLGCHEGRNLEFEIVED